MRAGKEESLLAAGRYRLLVSAHLQAGAEHVLVQRGMPVLASEGVEVGKVAAVVINDEDGLATHFLLGRLPYIAEYRLAPMDLISDIDQGSLKLSIGEAEIEALPVWHSAA